MTVYFDKGRKRWRYDFELNGRRRAGYCENEDGTPARNRTEALKAETVVRAGLIKTPNAPARRGTYTFAQALAAYVAIAQRHRNWESIKDYVAELKARIGPATPIDDVEGKVPDYIKWSRKQKVRIWRGGPRDKRTATLRQPGGYRDGERALWQDTGRTRSDSTTNRYLTTLRTILNLAHATKDPGDPQKRRRLLAEPPAFENLAEPEVAPRPLGDANLRQILEVAAASPGRRHVADVVALCIDAGLRLNEALALENDQFDPEYRGLWLRHANTKGKRDEFVPLGDNAFRLVQQRVKESRQSGQSRIVLYRGPHGTGAPRPIDNIGTSWRKILKDLGLKGRYRFHNTRADYVSYLGNLQVAPAALQGLARHRDFGTTLRYLKVSDAAKRQAVALLDARAATKGLDLAAAVLQPNRARTKPHPSPTQLSHTGETRSRQLRRKALK